MSARMYRTLLYTLMTGLLACWTYGIAFGSPGQLSGPSMALFVTYAALYTAVKSEAIQIYEKKKLPAIAENTLRVHKGVRQVWRDGAWHHREPTPVGGFTGPPEHIHWPEEVLSILEEPVGRHICVECYDECPAAIEYTIDGEKWVGLFRSWDDTVWIRNKAGEVKQLMLNAH